jgi:hypothetical protein
MFALAKPARAPRPISDAFIVRVHLLK